MEEKKSLLQQANEAEVLPKTLRERIDALPQGTKIYLLFIGNLFLVLELAVLVIGISNAMQYEPVCSWMVDPSILQNITANFTGVA